MRVVVAGAGVFGASIAFVLAKAGARVTLVDPAPIGANASGVAAGMLAPVFESLFEDGPECFARLIDARDDWPAFAAATAISINKPGALAVTRDKATLADWVARLGKIGASFVIRSQAEVARTRPDLAEGLFGVETWDDWRLEAQAALNALLSAVKGRGSRPPPSFRDGFHRRRSDARRRLVLRGRRPGDRDGRERRSCSPSAGVGGSHADQRPHPGGHRRKSRAVRCAV